MGTKKKKLAKRKNQTKENKPSSSSSHREWSSKFDILLAVESVRFFKWEILNFPHADAQCIFSDYFNLDRYRFRFRFFPKGQASSRNKYLSLQLETDEAEFRGFIRSKITIVNHIDASSSFCKYIFQRFASDIQSQRNPEFAPLDSLYDPELGFLLNGTDLHLRGDVISLDEDEHFRDLPLQPTWPIDAVTADETLRGTYKGDFIWKIDNYSFFEEIVKVGLIKSRPFWIGECQYYMRVGAPKDMNEDGAQCMCMFLEPLVKIDSDCHGGPDRNPWILSNIIVKSPVLRKQMITHLLIGRVERWLKLMKMSEFENSADQFQGTIPERNILRFRLKFYALQERDSVDRYIANSKAIWNFGEGSKAVTNSKKTVADKAFVHYSWNILNFSWIEMLVYDPDVKLKEIRSRAISVVGADIVMVIYPWGDSDHRWHLGLFLIPNPLNAGEEMNILVHYRLAAQNQIDTDRTTTREEIVRFDTAGKLYGFPEFILTSDFYKDSAGYVVKGGTTFNADIHILEESCDVRRVDMPNKYDDEVTRLRWRVENFLAWQGTVGAKPVRSKYFNVNGCALQIEVHLFNNGDVYGSLSSAPSHKKDDEMYGIVFQIGVVNQKKPTDQISDDWPKIVFLTNRRKKFCKMGTLSDILKEGAGFIVNDKVLFFCYIYRCTRRGQSASQP